MDGSERQQKVEQYKPGSDEPLSLASEFNFSIVKMFLYSK